MTIDTPLERSATRHWIAIGRVGGALAALLAAAVIGLALAGSVSAGWMGGHGGPGFGSRGMIMDGPLDPAEVKVRVERMVGHIAVEIDATDEQKEKLTAIFVSAANDLMPIRAEIIETRQAGELIGLLTAPTVDRAAIEAFRVEKMDIADRASRRVAQALGEAAEVLTPEQRVELGERLQFLMQFGPGFHRG
ncbi:MAG: Spy/CpxP family protein refolding chaperone [Bauldia sp.]|nr:Spy/CpxP family protein refolding chaperone [Bauldia sp.]